MIGELLALIGSILILLSALGVIRFADVLARLHALAKASTLGLLLVLTGAAVNLRDLNDITSVVLAGLLPNEYELSTEYAAGVCAGATDAPLASAFVAWIAGERAAALRRAGGFEG